MASIDLYGLDLEQGQADHAALRFTGSSSSLSPNKVNAFGNIGTAAGYGVSVDAGTDIQLHFSSFGGTQASLQTATSATIGGGILVDTGRNEINLTYQIDPTTLTVVNRPVRFSGNPSNSALSIGVGTNSASYSQDIDIGYNLTHNAVSTLIMGVYCNDETIIGHKVWCEYPIASNGNGAVGDLILGGTSTTATTITLTTNINNSITTSNTAIPHAGGVFAGPLRCLALDTLTGNVTFWSAPNAIVQKTSSAVSSAVLKVNGLASVYADSGASTWTFAASADTTTSGGMKVTFTGAASTSIHAMCSFASILEIH
jgi:hypothetical protein